MKRLTKRLEDEQAVMDCTGCPESWNTNPVGKCTALYCRNMLKDRLAAIEDILGDEYGLDELGELVRAKREGRCVVIPFKPPRWVYMCSERFPKPGEAYYASTINVLQDMEKGCVFGDTPEEAEAALRREQDE